MLHSLEDLTGVSVIGNRWRDREVCNFLFDDQSWTCVIWWSRWDIGSLDGMSSFR